jgi:pimeloyl-ACP methyl ester carboxylesterase
MVVMLVVGLPGAVAAAATPAFNSASCDRHCVRVWAIHYRSHAGARRNAYVVLPTWYRPDHNPRIPLVISPHGRGVTAWANVGRWGNLPAFGGFAVVNPEGQGRRLTLHSWGYAGQVADLARMPKIVSRAIPWLKIDTGHVYAFGTSMGGQESLLLVAQHPELLAGAAAFDAVADMARRYRDFPRVPCPRRCPRRWAPGRALQSLARFEIGGTPRSAPGAYARRSPISQVRRIAFSGVPLQLWWSRSDRIVVDQRAHSARLVRTIRRLNAKADVRGFTGHWPHSAEMSSHYVLRRALEEFGLIAERKVGESPPDSGSGATPTPQPPPG